MREDRRGSSLSYASSSSQTSASIPLTLRPIPRILFGNFPQNTARIASSDNSFGNIAHNHRPRADNRVRSDGHAGIDHGMGADPTLSPMATGSAYSSPSLRTAGINRMRGGVYAPRGASMTSSPIVTCAGSKMIQSKFA